MVDKREHKKREEKVMMGEMGRRKRNSNGCTAKEERLKKDGREGKGDR